jgi:S1-C subfamily serine protease
MEFRSREVIQMDKRKNIRTKAENLEIMMNRNEWITVFLLLICSILITIVYVPSSIIGQMKSEFNPQFDSINNNVSDISKKMDNINSSLWLSSQEHYLAVMNKIDNSVVTVISVPATQNKSNMDAVFYTDSNGNSWSVGTGFSINEKGYILTALHNVVNSTKVAIILKNGTVLGVPHMVQINNTDLALLMVDSGLPPVEVANSGQLLQEGSNIGFIGFIVPNPLQPPIRTTTIGTISAINSFTFGNTTLPVYIISSFVNHGESGGPIFSMQTGEVVGLINLGYTSTNGIGVCTIINKDFIAQFN